MAQVNVTYSLARAHQKTWEERAVVPALLASYHSAMVAVALPVDPTPASIEHIVTGLPAHTRAQLDWFPAALRTVLIEPLRRADIARWRQTLDDAAVESARLFLRLGQGVASLLRDPTLEVIIRQGSLSEVERSARVAARLEPIDLLASDELREANAWLRALLGALLDQFDVADAVQRELPSDQQIRHDLASTGGSFLRGMLLTVASTEVVLDERPIPDAIVEWCGLAYREVNVAANAFRARGVPVPTEVSVPGFSVDEWRQRTRSAVVDAFAPARGPAPLPRGVAERIVAVLAPEAVWLFGSRARGDNRPDSDWDLMAVLPDSASDDKVTLSNVWRDLRDLRRMRVDVFPIRRRRFDEERNTPGSLVETVVREGRLVYGE